MLIAIAVVLLAVALVASVGGRALIRRSGAQTAIGRRLAGARGIAVGDLSDLAADPVRPVRLMGRVRCPDPIRAAGDERLVARHRDVELLTRDAGWRSIERIRESRGFELWDHAGSVAVDPARAAEPLVSIPYVWEGDPDELDETYRPAIERVAAEHGAALRARATTRTISVVDRLLVVAEIRRDDAGRIRLGPPRGGYVIANLDLPDALRLLGGAGRRLLLMGAGIVAAGAALGVAGTVLLVVSFLAG